MRKVLASVFAWFLLAGTALAQTGIGQIPSLNVVGNQTGSPAEPAAWPIFTTPNTWTALQSYTAGISANAYNSTGGNYTFNGLSGVSGSPNIILNDVFVGTGQGGGVLFNALNSAAASVTSGYVNCGFSVNTAGSELGLCDQGYRAPSGVSQIITTAVNSSSAGCVLCSGNTDNFWTLGASAVRFANIYAVLGTFSGTLTDAGGYSGSVSNPTPPIQMGTFFQSGNNCVSHLAVNSTTYGFGVPAAGQLSVCSGGSIGFFPNGAGVSAPAALITTGGVIQGNNGIQTAGYLIAGLPTCNGGSQGLRAFVTNGATSPTFLGTVSATGAVIAPVFCNGTAWVYG